MPRFKLAKEARASGPMASPPCAVATCASSMRNSPLVEYGRQSGHCQRLADVCSTRGRTRRSCAAPSSGSGGSATAAGLAATSSAAACTFIPPRGTPLRTAATASSEAGTVSAEAIIDSPRTTLMRRRLAVGMSPSSGALASSRAAGAGAWPGHNSWPGNATPSTPAAKQARQRCKAPGPG